MYYYKKSHGLCNQEIQNNSRIPNPDVIAVPFGYQIEVAVQGLNSPIGIVFDDKGDLFVAESGLTTGEARILRVTNGETEVIAENFRVPISGINILNKDIYVSHRGVITIIGSDGSRTNIIEGLPSYGDYINNRVEFSSDGKIYFGQGTATNSGVVGLDNLWIPNHAYFCDIAGSPIIVKGINFETYDILSSVPQPIYTGAFSPFGVENLQPVEMFIGNTRASGSILRSNLDGSNLEILAWGFKNPFNVMFDMNGRLIIASQGMDDRGSRPIGNAPDTIDELRDGAWYGWPDFAAGVSVESQRFTTRTGIQPIRLLETIPDIPPTPIATLAPNSNIMGFDINYNPEFGPVGTLYIALFGNVYYDTMREYIRTGVGHRINQVDLSTGEVSTFAINRSGTPEIGGFGRPTDVVFGPDGAMYITDLGFDTYTEPNIFPPGSGIIWRISRMQY